MRNRTLCTLLALASSPSLMSSQTVASNPYLQLMQKAQSQVRPGAPKPTLSPIDHTVLNHEVPVAELQAQGFHVIPWTTNDPATMHTLLRMGVDGLISDRPDLLQKAVAEERAAGNPLAHFDVQAHRGGRGLRPENTLPSFESGLDQLVTTLETDTGVTTDHVSLIWHDQFLNPEHCRRADGAAYTLANRVYTRDLSMPEAQKTFVCDKLNPKFPDQRNDLALSPVAVTFAAQERMPSPYAPTHAEQLFRFTRFYAAFYRTGAGRSLPHAAERAANAERVRFNLETKILPDHVPVPEHLPAGITPDMLQNQTVAPQLFVDALAGAIKRQHLEARAEIQSFDFRTLLLVQAQHPDIPTVYLTESTAALATDFVPASLRTAP